MDDVDWTRFDRLMQDVRGGKKLCSFDKHFLHAKLRKRLARGMTVVRCAACSRLVFADEITLEHIVPLSLGGGYEQWNLTLSCAKCNRQRANTEDFWRWRVERHARVNRRPAPVLTWNP